MSATLTLPNDEAAILARAINPANWPLSAEAAEAFLKLKLADSDKARMDELAARARVGELSADEELEIEDYRQAGCQSRQFLASR